MSREGIALLESVFAAWNEGDVDGMLEMVDPDVEWRPGTDSPFPGLQSGLEGLARYTRSWANTFDRLQIELGEVRTRGDWLMADLRQRSRMRGSTVDIEAMVTHVWQVRHGKVTWWLSFRDEAEAVEFLEQLDD